MRGTGYVRHTLLSLRCFHLVQDVLWCGVVCCAVVWFVVISTDGANNIRTQAAFAEE